MRSFCATMYNTGSCQRCCVRQLKKDKHKIRYILAVKLLTFGSEACALKKKKNQQKVENKLKFKKGSLLDAPKT